MRLLAIGLLCVSCARGFDLPAPRVGPTVRALAPSEGYADDLIAISGDNFDPLPANNQIFFQGQTTTADSIDAQGRLLVYVPYNLTSAGPIVVSTPAGKSAPFGNFNNLGSGHPTLGVTVGDAQVRHSPPALAAIQGDLFVPSQYFRLLLSRQGTQLRLPGKPVAFAASSDGVRFIAAFDDGTLREIDRASLAVSSGVTPAFAVSRLTAAPGVVFAVGAAPDGSIRAQAFATPGLTAGLLRTVPALAVHGAVAAPDGVHLVLAVDRDAGGSSVPALLVVDMSDANAQPVLVSTPGGRAATGALAVAQFGAVDHVAVAFDDGSMSFLSLGAAPAFGAVSSLVSEGRVGGFAFDALSGHLVATKPREGMALVVDTSGTVLAAISLRGEPTLATADASTGHVFIADSASNGFDELDVAQQKWLGRFDFGTGLGDTPDCDCAPAAAYAREDQGTDHHMYFLAPRMKQLVALDSYTLALLTPAVLDESASRPLGVVGTPDGSVWVLHQSEVGSVANNTETIAFSGLTEAPAGLVKSGSSVVVRSLHSLDVYRGNARAGGVSIADGTIVNLAADSAGVVAFWTKSDGSVHGGRWTADALAAGAAPSQKYDAAPGLLGYGGVLDLGLGPLLFYSSCGEPPAECTVQLDPSLAAAGPSASPLDQAAPILTSPDARYFLWSRKTDKDGVLHLAYASDQVSDYTSWQIPIDFAQPNFDPSGEWVYVPVPTLDEIHVLQ